MEAIINFLQQTGFSLIAENWKVLVMILIAFVLMYLAIVKKFEPLLLLPIAFGMLLTNLPGAEMFHEELFAEGHVLKLDAAHLHGVFDVGKISRDVRNGTESEGNYSTDLIRNMYRVETRRKLRRSY